MFWFSYGHFRPGRFDRLYPIAHRTLLRTLQRFLAISSCVIVASATASFAVAVRISLRSTLQRSSRAVVSGWLGSSTVSALLARTRSP
jgi:hypothetical protein